MPMIYNRQINNNHYAHDLSYAQRHIKIYAQWLISMPMPYMGYAHDPSWHGY